MLSEEQALLADPRLDQAIDLFNAGDWYACHDVFEELWHETQGPIRPVLQGILQIAVAQLHQQRNNHRGATILMGEGLGRLRGCDNGALGLELSELVSTAARHLVVLQQQEQNAESVSGLPPLRLIRLSPPADGDGGRQDAL